MFLSAAPQQLRGRWSQDDKRFFKFNFPLSFLISKLEMMSKRAIIMISILKPLGFSCFTNTFEKDKMTLDIVLLLPDC